MSKEAKEKPKIDNFANLSADEKDFLSYYRQLSEEKKKAAKESIIFMVVFERNTKGNIEN